MGSFTLAGIWFPMDQDGGKWCDVRVGPVPIGRCCFRCETTETLVALGEDIPSDGYAITIRTGDKYLTPWKKALEMDRFKHLRFKDYPKENGGVCSKKKYIYFGTDENRTADYHFIMGLMNFVVAK